MPASTSSVLRRRDEVSTLSVMLTDEEAGGLASCELDSDGLAERVNAEIDGAVEEVNALSSCEPGSAEAGVAELADAEMVGANDEVSALSVFEPGVIGNDVVTPVDSDIAEAVEEFNALSSCESGSAEVGVAELADPEMV
ncbi:hypothetical protein [Endozoicomonas sp. GU-1]|uniref:hypothetical protein n=1 Tax=Endozoicomonas sp. GU-1 TaxID=3009078 RepID=UPI0022B5D13A|nr:hypothetical protein [Endozoicomonas sp. GU-1]WBA81229.1 hypothetical protein O2T12_23530 [Endozoicomonas sp. GU-1]WBA84177.1 hypothetical protein O3276_12710 [Endozoicomonas sp. GU-1]